LNPFLYYFHPFSPYFVTILLVINEWVAPSSNNISILKLFIGSVLASTSDTSLTSSCVKWKTLHRVRSFYAPSLSRLGFASNWEDLTDLFTMTDYW
jgi:hypothetical protein